MIQLLIACVPNPFCRDGHLYRLGGGVSVRARPAKTVIVIRCLCAAPDYIVSVGRGIAKEVEGEIQITQELADELGSVLGSSRAVVDAGWLSADHQAGQTGVHPKVYIALDISGAIQHKAGMQDSECIIAVDKNDGASICEIADYGICGDLFKVVPELIESVQALKALK